MTDPNNTNPTSSTNPQDLIDQALGATPTPAPTNVPSDEPNTNAVEPLPTLEPLADAPVESEPASTVADEAPVSAMPTELVPPPTTQPMPAEPAITEPQVASQTNDEPKAAMGEEVPLAFMGGQPPLAETAPPINSEPTIPAAITNSFDTTSASKKPKSSMLKMAGTIVGIFAFVMVGGYVAFNALGGVSNPALVAVVSKVPLLDGVLTPKQAEKQVKEDIKKRQEEKAADDEEQGGGGGGGSTPATPTFTSTARVKKPSEADTAAECSGCSAAVDGGWLVWRNGECKVTGICNSSKPEKNTDDPMTENANTPTACANAGGTWCTGTDLRSQTYGFCNGTSGAGVKTCQSLAAEKGYSVLIGSFAGVCKQTNGTWKLTEDSAADYQPYNNDNYRDPTTGKTPLDRANDLCAAGNGTLNFGNAKYICRMGQRGDGGEVYTGGACTAKNGKVFTGTKLGCFCGTVQVDTGEGHTSYSSSCGCDEEEEENTPNPSPSPSVPVTVSLMCTGITRTPTTAPAIGDKLTFTCTGATTPAGATTLSYKFRYSINSGNYTTLSNKTATTAELTVAQCGTYKVQCQTCGLINGVQTCDPVWTAATAN